MKKVIKSVLLISFIIVILVFPNISFGVTTAITNEVELQDALNNPNTDIIVLTNDIHVPSRITLPDENRTINIQSNQGKTIRANGTGYIFQYNTGENNLNINFSNVIVDGNYTASFLYMNGQNGYITINQLQSINTRNIERPDGGSIYKETGTLTLNYAIFDSSTADGNGGVIYNDGGEYTIESSRFTNNSANEGGAIYTTDLRNLFVDSQGGTVSFNGNQAAFPTYIEFFPESIDIHNQQVIGNYITSITPYLYNNFDVNFGLLPASYRLYYDPNTSDPVQNIPPIEDHLVGENVVISNQIPIRIGYTFSSWNTQADGSGIQYRPNDSFIMPDSAVTLYAQWEPISYVLHFDPNTSDPVSNVPTDIIFNYGDQITIPSEIPQRDGYTFTGWNTRPDELGTTFQPGDIIFGFDSDQILYAQWTPNPVDIIYDANTVESVENLPATESRIPGEVATISEQVPTRSGYVFTGWNTQADGTGIAYQPGESYVVPENGLMLYAQWQRNEENLTFDPNTTDPVQNLPGDINYIPGETISIPDQIPTRDNYVFIGWNTAPDGIGTQYQPGDTLIGPEGGLTLYAQWEPNEEPPITIIIIIIIIGIGTIILATIISCKQECFCNCCYKKEKRYHKKK